MPESDPLTILLAHDRWATGQIFDACAKLPDEKFHRRFEMGPGSLHDTLTHMTAAMQAWTDTLAETQPRPWLQDDGQRRTPEQIRALFEEAWQAIAAEAPRRPLGEVVTRHTRDGRTFNVTRGVVLTHVATHGMHHRAQCLNMLRQSGVKPLPPTSVTEWTWLGEART